MQMECRHGTGAEVRYRSKLVVVYNGQKSWCFSLPMVCRLNTTSIYENIVALWCIDVDGGRDGWGGRKRRRDQMEGGRGGEENIEREGEGVGADGEDGSERRSIVGAMSSMKEGGWKRRVEGERSGNVIEGGKEGRGEWARECYRKGGKEKPTDDIRI